MNPRADVFVPRACSHRVRVFDANVSLRMHYACTQAVLRALRARSLRPAPPPPRPCCSGVPNPRLSLLPVSESTNRRMEACPKRRAAPPRRSRTVGEGRRPAAVGVSSRCAGPMGPIDGAHASSHLRPSSVPLSQRTRHVSREELASMLHFAPAAPATTGAARGPPRRDRPSRPRAGAGSRSSAPLSPEAFVQAKCESSPVPVPRPVAADSTHPPRRSFRLLVRASGDYRAQLLDPDQSVRGAIATMPRALSARAPPRRRIRLTGPTWCSSPVPSARGASRRIAPSASCKCAPP